MPAKLTKLIYEIAGAGLIVNESDVHNKQRRMLNGLSPPRGSGDRCEQLAKQLESVHFLLSTSQDLSDIQTQSHRMKLRIELIDYLDVPIK